MNVPASVARHEQDFAGFLRCGVLPWPAACQGEQASHELLEAAEAHRVLPLLHAAGARSGLPGWPATARRQLAHRARRAAVGELRRTHALRQTLHALADAGVAVLAIKGEALAHSVYPSPALRPRCDSDLLVAPEQRERAERCLARLGHQRGPRIRGRRVEYQAPWIREVAGLRCVVDLHWRVSNRQSLAPRFDFGSLWRRGRGCPALAAGVRIPDRVDALQIAAIHGPAHHGGQFQPLLWHYDVHLLYLALRAEERTALLERSHARGVGGLVAAALGEARARFATPRAPELADLAPPGEASAALLKRRGRRLFLHDLRHLPGLRPRLELLREAALPDTDFLRWRYAAGPEVSRTRLLARRLVAAAAHCTGLGAVERLVDGSHKGQPAEAMSSPGGRSTG